MSVMESPGAEGVLRSLPGHYSTREDLDAVLRAARELGASDLYIGGNEPIRARIHGRLLEMTRRRLNPGEARRMMVVSYDDDASIESIIGAGGELDYSYECTSRDGMPRLRWRANACGRLLHGQNDLRVVLRHIETIPPTVEKLELPAAVVSESDALTRGLVVVTGPTGSGKSTTLGALLRRRVENPADHVHLITLESPIEYVYDEVAPNNSVVTQREIGRHTESFARGVVNALRQDPDLILVGETRDRATAEAGLLAAQTGHGVYTTTHTNGVANTLDRLLAAFPQEERELAKAAMIDTVHLVVSQRLIPTLDGRRAAVWEYLVLDGDIKARLRRARDLFTAVQTALLEQGQPMMSDVRTKAESGLVAVAELQRFEQLWRLEASIDRAGGVTP